MNLKERSKLDKLINDLDHLMMEGVHLGIDFQITITDGILTRDPNLRNLPDGTDVCDFGIESSDSSWDPHPYILMQGIDFERFLCLAYGQNAKTIYNYYRKGNQINIKCLLWTKETFQATSNFRYDKSILLVNEITLSEIQQICYERDIQSLCHFTRTERLRSILHRGLLSRKFLEELPKKVRPLFSDQDRKDGYKEAICLSISFPNYRMFFSKTGRAKQHEWVVLLLDVRILWELDCAFCHQNAIYEPVLRVPLEYRKKLVSLKRMFWDSDENVSGVRYQRQQIPDNFTTHPEAEVLVFGTIATEYINEICFYNQPAFTKWQRENSGNYPQRFCVNDHYFRPSA